MPSKRSNASAVASIPGSNGPRLANSAIQSLWIVAASLCFAMMGVFVKLASEHVALSELLFYRGATTAAVTAMVLHARGEGIRTSRFGLHAVRGITGFVALAMFFEAMKELPLGTAVARNYTSPVHMAALSAWTIPRRKRLFKDECLDRMIFVGQGSLRRAVIEYMNHYHAERNHQGLENRLIHLPTAVTAQSGAVHRHARLGGTLNFYYRNAA